MFPKTKRTAIDKRDLLFSQWSWQTIEYYKIPCQSSRELIPPWDQAPSRQGFRVLQPDIISRLCRKLLPNRWRLKWSANFSPDRYTSQHRAQRGSNGNSLPEGGRMCRSLTLEARTQDQRILDRLPWSRTMKMSSLGTSRNRSILRESLRRLSWS